MMALSGGFDLAIVGLLVVSVVALTLQTFRWRRNRHTAALTVGAMLSEVEHGGPTTPIGGEVWVERTKWPDLPHYGAQGTLLGADDHGWWVGFEVHHPVYRGEQVLFLAPHASVQCISHHDWYMAHWPSGPELELYVDIVTPPMWSERGAAMVDVDFDVVVRGGVATLVDEDEFEAHRHRHGYPAELVAGARRAAADVFARVEARLPPFTPEDGARWHRRLVERTSS